MTNQSKASSSPSNHEHGEPSAKATARERANPATSVVPTSRPIGAGDNTVVARSEPEQPRQGAATPLQAIKTMDPSFARALVGMSRGATSVGIQGEEAGLDFVLSVVEGMPLHDQVLAMLGQQIAAVHAATMTTASRLTRAKTLAEQDICQRMLNQLARTFTAQLDTMTRYRSGGADQKISVQHVSVNDGGQAIVGNVSQAPRARLDDNRPAPVPGLTHSSEKPMPIVAETRRRPLPLRSRR